MISCTGTISKAEAIIASENLDKEYATIAGVPAFAKASALLAFGKDMNGLVSVSENYDKLHVICKFVTCCCATFSRMQLCKLFLVLEL